MMYGTQWGEWGMRAGEAWFPWFLGLVSLLVLWGIFWKGLALWHSARRGSYVWFIAFLLINILGILEIVYLFFVLKLKFRDLFNADTARRDAPRVE